MDVRCEKCQTEYELDESRLKPGGVTVKCTNCGHMFKIRKRTPTNVTGVPTTTPTGLRAPGASGGMSRADSILDEHRPEEGPTTVERQWVIRLENGEQKTCKELATLQQWIVSNVVSRESLISRTGKTWKRLGDIAELAQYFDIAEEARTSRRESEKQTRPVAKQPAAGTMLGVGASAAGGTILRDDDEEAPTGRRPQTPPPALPSTRTPPMGSNVATPRAARPPTPAPPLPEQPLATAPTMPAPRLREPSEPARLREPSAGPAPSKVPAIPDGRSTAMWASDPVKAAAQGPSGPSGPFVGKLAIPDEPAFAGRVRVSPSDESSFDTGKVGYVEDDDDLMPRRSGSKAGLVIVLMMLIVGAGAAALVYMFVIKKDAKVAVVSDAAGSAAIADAAVVVVAPIIDATEAPPPSPLEDARAELGQDVETRLRTQLEALPKDAPETQALRANIGAAIVQSLNDRAGLVADKALADKLRKDSKTLVLDAATAAQRAFKATPDDAGANVAMANVLRLQGKSLKDMQRYLDAAKQGPTASNWSRDVLLAEALVHARDAKLDDARKALEAIDAGPNKLETSNDVRARFHLGLIALAQNRASDAKAAVDAVLAAQPEHAGAKDLATKLETKTSSSDPLPPEDPPKDPPKDPAKDPGKGSATKPPPGDTTVATSGTYDQLLARANKLAETQQCGKAIELFAKALEQKPNGVEALAGQGYCHIDAKQFASAFSKFRSALAISPRYEPALWGIAEAYQQQGRKEQALEAYKKYLEVYPGTAKAQKQVERLQGSTTPTPTPEQGSATQPTPQPTPPDPTQQPQKPDPAPEGGGSGAQ